MPKAFCSQSKSLIAAAVAYFEAERNNGGLLLPLTAVRERVSDIKQVHALVSPKRKHNKKKTVVNIDNFTECAIRNAVYNMYKNKQHITPKSLQAVLCETDIFVSGCTSLWKVLQNIGFRYNKEDPRRALVELPHIILKRVQFLSDYIRLKNAGNFQFVFIYLFGSFKMVLYHVLGKMMIAEVLAKQKLVEKDLPYCIMAIRMGLLMVLSLYFHLQPTLVITIAK